MAPPSLVNCTHSTWLPLTSVASSDTSNVPENEAPSVVTTPGRAVEFSGVPMSSTENRAPVAIAAPAGVFTTPAKTRSASPAVSVHSVASGSQPTAARLQMSPVGTPGTLASPHTDRNVIAGSASIAPGLRI